MIEWVNTELEAWGSFMQGGAVQLGFSRESLEYRMMTYGPDSLIKDGSVSNAPDPYLPDNVARAEFILRDRFILPRELRLTAVTVYTRLGMSREDQAVAVSRKIGVDVSRRKLMSLIDNLHHRYDTHVNTIERYAKKDWVLLK